MRHHQKLKRNRSTNERNETLYITMEFMQERGRASNWHSPAKGNLKRSIKRREMMKKVRFSNKCVANAINHVTQKVGET